MSRKVSFWNNFCDLSSLFNGLKHCCELCSRRRLFSLYQNLGFGRRFFGGFLGLNGLEHSLKLLPHTRRVVAEVEVVSKIGCRA
jgi:hypothetical protein